MTLSNNHLSEHLQRAQETLASLSQELDENPQLQQALSEIMQPRYALEAFERLIVSNRQLATQVLMASVAALTNLHVTASIKRELSRRAESN